MRALIEEALMHCHGNAENAAAYLGLKTQSLYKRAQRLGIDWQDVTQRARRTNWLFDDSDNQGDCDE
jgi:DNA-binding NtrC family response regulator